jgi:hypothetical protein
LSPEITKQFRTLPTMELLAVKELLQPVIMLLNIEVKVYSLEIICP